MSNTIDLWDIEESLTDMGIEVPAWIEQDITGSQVAAIVQGGCASGAYMPAVTYHEAEATMARYSQEVEETIVDAFGELDYPDDTTWTQKAVWAVSVAVETWAMGVEDSGEIERAWIGHKVRLWIGGDVEVEVDSDGDVFVVREGESTGGYLSWEQEEEFSEWLKSGGRHFRTENCNNNGQEV